MGANGTVIARAIGRCGPAPRVLADALGTEDPDAVAAVVGEFCLRHLAAPAAAYEIAINTRCEWSDGQVRA